MLEGLENVIKADSARSTKVDCTSSVEEYINRSDWRIKANANTGYSSAGLVNNLAGKMIANYWLDKVYNKKEGDAHRNGDYHIHDLDILGAYCFTADTKIKTVEYGEISIKDLLAKNVDEFTVYSTDYAEKEIELKLESDITKEDAEEYNSHFMTCKAKNLRKTRENAELIKVQFSDNYSVRCTPDHKFLTAGVHMDERYCPVRSFKWVEAKDLKKNDINVICCDGSMVYVKSVANIDEKEDVYCMEVEDTHCFALENGVIAHNCCGHDLMRLLNEGFNGVVDRVGSKAPKHFREALYQMANYIGILQSEWAGAQAFSSFDTYLAPYVFFDMAFGGLTIDDVKKAIRNFVFNLNVPSRWGQSPFSNVTIDVVVPNDLKDIPPNRNDQPIFLDIYEEYKDKLVTDKDTATRWDRFMEALYKRMSKYEQLSHDCTDEDLLYMPTYKHFKEEMEIIDIAFYEVLNEGDINGMPFTFPIPTINVTEDFAWDSKVANVIFENAAKYGSSYFQNFIGSQYKRNPETGELERDPNAYKPNDVRSMCPLTGDTKILTLSSKGISSTELYHLDENKHKVWSNGKWVNFKRVDVEKQKVYAVKLSNGLTVKMGEHHLQPTHRGTLECKDLIVGDLIPFNTDVITWSGETGSYSLGYAIGAYYGDGNKDSEGICYSLASADKDIETEAKLKAFWKSLGYKVTTIIEDGLRRVRIGGNSFELISRFVLGDNAINKNMSAAAFSLNEEARNGIIDGYIATDGSRNRNRISTSSQQMVDDLMTLFTIQGKKSLLSFVDNREGRLGNNPNYVVSYPQRNSYADYFKTIDDVLYYTITEIKEVEQQKLYCIEVEDESHVFTLANGMITHNCRLQLDKTQLRKRGGGLFGADAQTGSVGVVTINMARLGYLYKGDEKTLVKKLDGLMELAKSTLEKKRKFVVEMNKRGLYPYTRRYLKTFDTFFSTIGVNGMNEMVRNFTNDEYDITDPRGKEMCIRILDHIRERLMQFQDETGNLYNLEATPAEGTTYRLAKEDKKRFVDIIQAGVPEAPYYTNSSQIPASFTADAFEALDLQDDLQCKYTGGTVLHLYMSEPLSSGESCKKLVKSVLSNYRLPYVSVTPTYSICPIHGYIPGNHKYCPLCDKNIMSEHAEELDANS